MYYYFVTVSARWPCTITIFVIEDGTIISMEYFGLLFTDLFVQPTNYMLRSSINLWTIFFYIRGLIKKLSRLIFKQILRCTT